jgi:hypothetical protein
LGSGTVEPASSSVNRDEDPADDGISPAAPGTCHEGADRGMLLA